MITEGAFEVFIKVEKSDETRCSWVLHKDEVVEEDVEIYTPFT